MVLSSFLKRVVGSHKKSSDEEDVPMLCNKKNTIYPESCGGSNQSDCQWILSQRAINEEIIDIINDAKHHLTWISMMSQHSNPDLIDAINDAIYRGVNVSIFHCVNPYVPYPSKSDSVATLIPMHGNWIPTLVSMLLRNYTHPFRSNVTHSRFIISDTHVMFGGVDYNKVCEIDQYVQNALKISLQHPPKGFHVQEINGVVSYLKQNGNLYKYRFSLRSALIGTSSRSVTALDQIIGMIKKATKFIFIENQYFSHTGVLSAIAQRQSECPDVVIILVGNKNYLLNPYHPGKNKCVIESYMNWIFTKEINKSVQFLKDRGTRFQFRTYPHKYTHNKIFIADETIAVGTMNCNKRSLDRNNDCEIGVVINERKDVIMEYVKDTMKKTQVFRDTRINHNHFDNTDHFDILFKDGKKISQ